MAADGSLRFVRCQFVARFANCENGCQLLSTGCDQ